MSRTAAVVVAAAIVLALAAAGSYALALPPLPLPSVPGLLPPPAPTPTPSRGAPAQPAAPCPSTRRVHGGVPRGRLHRIRVRRVADTFRASMFGIAAGGLIQKESCPDLIRDVGNDVRAGARWLRIDINWAEIQNGGPSQYDWSHIDRVVKVATAQGLRVLGGIEYTPWWARPLGTTAMYAPDPTTYGTFAAAAARHYSALGVHTFEIWNEPNTTNFWQPAPNPAKYTAILKAAYVKIKGVDPTARVLTGGTAPSATSNGNYSPIDFLSGIYAAGGQGFFDAVAHHPYCWPTTPGDPDPTSAWFQMYGTSPSLRSVMTDHGDRAKKIWVTEFGAPTDGPTGTFVSDGAQAKMVTQAYKLFASYKWAGPLFFYQGRDLGASANTDQNFFGLTRYNFSPKPAFTAYASIRNAILRIVHQHSRHSAGRHSHRHR